MWVMPAATRAVLRMAGGRVAFALLTPFFFLRAGLLISFPALLSGAAVIGLLFAVKMVTKVIAVYPLAVAFRMSVSDRMYTTLLMATG